MKNKCIVNRFFFIRLILFSFSVFFFLNCANEKKIYRVIDFLFVFLYIFWAFLFTTYYLFLSSLALIPPSSCQHLILIPHQPYFTLQFSHPNLSLRPNTILSSCYIPLLLPSISLIFFSSSPLFSHPSYPSPLFFLSYPPNHKANFIYQLPNIHHIFSLSFSLFLFLSFSLSLFLSLSLSLCVGIFFSAPKNIVIAYIS